MNEVKGVGVDIVEIARFAEVLMRRGEAFRARVFAPAEQSYCDAQARPVMHFAARFAAKEAVMKVLGTGWAEGVGFADIEVLRSSAGRPTVVLNGAAGERARALGIDEVLLSLSHTESYACAFATGVGAHR